MSANSTVTSLRSSPPAPRPELVGSTVVGVTRVPHCEQNTSVGCSSWPHVLQAKARAVPQDEQNLAPSALTAPHSGHVVTLLSLGGPQRRPAARALPVGVVQARRLVGGAAPGVRRSSGSTTVSFRLSRRVLPTLGSSSRGVASSTTVVGSR